MKLQTDKDYHVHAESDALADVLRFMGLQGRVFCKATLRSPWALSIPADNLIHFHHIQKGVCRLRTEQDDHEWLISAGELVILTGGKQYFLYDAQEQAAENILDVIASAERGNGCSIVRLGGSGAKTQMLCGSFQLIEHRAKMLLPLLPSIFVFEKDKFLSRTALEAVLDLISVEATSQQPGSSLVLSKLVEILFIQILRSWVNSPEGRKQTSWINALEDEKIAPAMRALHACPEHDWTVESLAAHVNLSRSPFAQRFRQAVGQTPMAYLRQLRLHNATELLAGNNMTLKEIAGRVGYDSEASFSKAFKAVFGVAPGMWRNSIQ